MGVSTVAVYSDADRDAPHVREAREAVRIGSAPARDSYLRIENLIEAAKRTAAEAIHPGYGFLAENAEFAQRCAEAGLTFIGPRAETIRAVGSKIEARKVAERAGVPVIPQEGFPLLVKAAAGGGGKGMRRVDREQDLEEAKRAAAREAESAFGDGALLVERYLEQARHIEVQIFGGAHGKVFHMFERECSIQRRHQKVIEESPAPNLPGELRAALHSAAVAMARQIGYTNAGTVEFLVTPAGDFFFLEVNARIQVEHPVTEMVLGIDLVRMQIEAAEGRAIRALETAPRGHAIEARLYAEDAANGFMPSTGKILLWRAPENVRVESGIDCGTEVGIHYDPMLAKIIAHGDSRDDAIRKLRAALARTVVHGVTTNRDYLIQMLDHPEFALGRAGTSFAIEYARNQSGEAPARAALDAYLTIRRQQSRRILPKVPAGFRNNPFRDRPDSARVISCEPGHVRVEIDGAQHSFDISEGSDRYWVGNHVFAAASRYPASAAAPQEESASSPMPGTVLRVLVEPNGEVHPGDPLVILEAMKMEQTVRAHAEGVVDSVRVRPGQVVAPGETLVVVRAKGEQK